MNRFYCVAAMASAAILTFDNPVAAQVTRYDPAMTQQAAPLLTDVRFGGGHGFRRFHGGGFGHRFHGGGFGRHRFGYRGGFGRGRGAAIGAGVAGLAAGALIGGALASQAGPGYGYGYGYDPGYAYAPPPVPAGDATAYCAQRFKSYDPAIGTYLGYDGQRHPCP